MIIHNAAITGSLTLNGIDISDITGSEAGVGALNDFSSSILSYTASNDARLTALNAQTASILSYTSSNDAKISAIYTATSSLNASVSLLNAQSASLLSYTSSNDARVNALNSFSSSILSYTSSTDAKIASIYSTTSSLNASVTALNDATASLNSYTSSNTTNIVSLFATSASLNANVAGLNLQTASLLSYTASNNANIVSLNSYTSSNNTTNTTQNTRLGALEAATASIYTTTASLNASVSSLNTYTSSLNAKTASFATTGSNTFTGQQYISNASQAANFTSTASFYTDGGARITKDMYVSGTAYFNNITVFGTQSVSYISSSQLNIGTNLITVNTDTPSIRFGGLAVYDSGSTGLTGSILWDSQNNHWVYSNPSGSSYSGGMFISGPRSAALGSEQGTTLNALMKGQGGDHITSSAIFEDGTLTSMYSTMYISSSGNVGIGTSSPQTRLHTYASNDRAAIRIQNTAADKVWELYPAVPGVANSGFSIYNVTDNTVPLHITDTGNVGIGTTNPQIKLDIGYDTNNRSLVRLSSNAANRMAAVRFDGNNVESGYIGYEGGSEIVSGGVQGDLIIRNMLSGKDIILDVNAGSVGIGTTSPSVALDVVGSIRSTGTGLLSSIRINNTTSTTGKDWHLYSLNNGNFGLYNNTDGSYAYQITPSGNVGIGTTSPYQNLQVYQTGTAGNNYVEGTIQVGGTSSTLGAALSYAAQNSGYVNLVNLNTSGGANARISLGFGAISSGLPASTVMTLNQSGNVGIGTTSPSNKLDVNGYATLRSGLVLEGGATSAYREILFNTSGANRWNLYVYGSEAGANAGGDLRLARYADNGGYLGEAMTFIRSNGSVGIGSTSPGYRLDVNGQVNSKGYVINGDYSAVSSVPNAGIYGTDSSFTDGFNSLIVASRTDAARPIIFATYNGSAFAERVRITSGGNVGIGTTSPGYSLQVGNTGAGYNMAIIGSATAGIEIRTSTAGGRIAALEQYFSNEGSLWLYDSNTTKVLFRASGSSYINPTVGNVGIGTTDPSYKLDVSGTTRTTGNTVLASGGTYVSIGGAPFYAGTSVGSLSIKGDLYPGIAFYTGSGGLDQVGQIFSYAGTGNMILAADPRGIMSSTTMQFEIDGGTKMLINSSGNVGIGTTSPTQKLEVVGGEIKAGRVDSSSEGGQVSFGRASDNATGWYIDAYGSTSSPELRFVDVSNSAVRMTITGSNVGINSTAPGYLLDVNGTARFGSVIVGSLGTGTVYSNGGTLTNTNPSDRNLKENITPIEYGLYDVLQLNPVSFNWKDGTNGKQFGFIAQEVQEVMPDAIKEGEYLGLEKDAIYSALVNAVKELKAQNDTLLSRIEQLENK